MSLGLWFSLMLIVLIAYKAINNFANLKKIRFYKKIYGQYLSLYSKEAVEKRVGDSFTEDEMKFVDRMHENRIQIIELFKKAGLSSFSMTVMVPSGYNHVTQKEVWLFDNLTCMETIGNISIPNTILMFFSNSIGVFKARIKDSFSLLYWINCLLFFPQNMITYLGYPLETKKINLIAKVLNIAYWCFAVCMQVFLIIFHPLILFG